MLQRTRPAEFSKGQREDLARDIAANIEGEVRFDDGSRALYATDGSNYRQPPIGVVIPRDADDVIATVAACRRHGAPILGRGGGTSLAGQCCNVAVVIDMSKYMHDILEIDPERRIARVQPGVILDHLREQAEKHHLTFAPDPATHNHNTLGGMIGNNSCGIHSVMGGRTADNVESLDVITYDGERLRVGPTPDEELEAIIAAGDRRGEIYAGLKAIRDRYADRIRSRYPDIPRRVSGFNLDELLPERGFQVARALVGTESTCALVLEATLRLVPSPPVRSLLVLGYPDVYAAGDHVPAIMAHGPVGLEGIDDRLVNDVREMRTHRKGLSLLPEGNGWLLVELGGETEAEAKAKTEAVMEALRQEDSPPNMRCLLGEESHPVWAIRESGLAATAHPEGARDTWPGWEDAAVPPDRVGEYLRDFRGLLDRYGYACDLYGHFGQGCIHTRIDFDLANHDGVKRFESFIHEAADLVVSYGGALSGEHGDGQARAELLPKMYGEDLVQAFREFKAVWDPDWKMNPGKVVDPYRADQNLRLGPHYRPARVSTYFAYPEDGHDFGKTALRCVGVGVCRRHSHGVMCPSYMVTLEEKDSTRGRARMLFEMLQGDVITGGWQEEAVKDALHLCLSCKGCKNDCPVNVDMASYKAEFLAHYYERHRRPLRAYAFGFINRWSRLASHMPGFVNRLTGTQAIARPAKRLLGLAPERDLPRYAAEPFTEWFARYRRRHPAPPGREPVMLWPDTFNNFFYPQIAAAAVEVLEHAGFEVRLPRQYLCCGRPLYEYGMLDTAKAWLERIVDTLQEEVDTGMHVVGLEPACTAVFRDELLRLLPTDPAAQRLAGQTLLLSEFLQQKAPELALRQREEKAVVHVHCNHHALMGSDDEAALLDRVGLDYQILDSGCCGLAGSFGYDADKYEVSVACGERVLAPAVRAADRDTLVITDGFACREQIRYLTGRRAQHLAEVLADSLPGGRADTTTEDTP